MTSAGISFLIKLQARTPFLLNISGNCTTQKMKLSIRDFFSKTADLATFTEEILNGKLHFLCIGAFEVLTHFTPTENDRHFRGYRNGTLTHMG